MQSRDGLVLKEEVLGKLAEVNAKLDNKKSYTIRYAEAVESTVEMLSEGVEGDVEDILDFYFQVLFLKYLYLNKIIYYYSIISY